MATDITAARLKVLVNSDPRPMLRGLRKSRKGLRKTSNEAKILGNAFKSLNSKASSAVKSLTNLGSIIAVIGGSAGIGKIVKDTTAWGERMFKLSAAINVSVERLQLWDRVLAQNEVAIDEFAQAMIDLSTKMADVRNGSQDIVRTFNQLGLSIEQLGKNPEQALIRILDRLYELEQAGQIDVALNVGARLFGVDKAKKIQTVVASTGGDIEGALKDVAKIYPVITGSQAKTLTEINTRIFELGVRLQTATRKAVADNINTINKVVKTLEDNLPMILERLVFLTDFLVSNFRGLTNLLAGYLAFSGLSLLTKSIKSLIKIFKAAFVVLRFVPALFSIIPLILAAVEGFARLLGVQGPLGIALSGLGLAFDKVLGLIGFNFGDNTSTSTSNSNDTTQTDKVVNTLSHNITNLNETIKTLIKKEEERIQKLVDEQAFQNEIAHLTAREQELRKFQRQATSAFVTPELTDKLENILKEEKEQKDLLEQIESIGGPDSRSKELDNLLLKILRESTLAESARTPREQPGNIYGLDSAAFLRRRQEALADDGDTESFLTRLGSGILNIFQELLGIGSARAAELTPGQALQADINRVIKIVTQEVAPTNEDEIRLDKTIKSYDQLLEERYGKAILRRRLELVYEILDNTENFRRQMDENLSNQQQALNDEIARLGVNDEDLTEFTLNQQIDNAITQARIEASKNLETALVNLRRAQHEYSLELEGSGDRLEEAELQFEAANLAIDKLNQEIEEGDPHWRQMARNISNTKKELSDIDEQKRQWEQLGEKIKSSMETAFENVLFDGASLKDQFKIFIQEIIKELIRLAIIRPLVQGITGSIGGALGIPGLASGGVGRGLTIVGERGPELVDFNNPGRVYTNADLRSALGGTGSGLQVVNNWHIQSTDGPGVTAAIRQAENRMVSASVASVANELSQRTSAMSALVRQRSRE